MPAFQGKFSDTTYICVAGDLHEAIRVIEREGERRGDDGPLSLIKEVDALVIGMSEPGPTQSRLFPSAGAESGDTVRVTGNSPFADAVREEYRRQGATIDDDGVIHTAGEVNRNPLVDAAIQAAAAEPEQPAPDFTALASEDGAAWREPAPALEPAAADAEPAADASPAVSVERPKKSKRKNPAKTRKGARK